MSCGVFVDVDVAIAFAKESCGVSVDVEVAAFAPGTIEDVNEAIQLTWDVSPVSCSPRCFLPDLFSCGLDGPGRFMTLVLVVGDPIEMSIEDGGGGLAPRRDEYISLEKKKKIIQCYN